MQSTVRSIEVPLTLKTPASTVIAPKVLNVGFATDYAGTGTRLSSGNATHEDDLLALIDQFNEKPSPEALAVVRDARKSVVAKDPSQGLGIARLVMQTFDAPDLRVPSNFDKTQVHNTFKELTPKVLSVVSEDRYKVGATLNVSAVALVIKDGKPVYNTCPAKVVDLNLGYNPSFNPAPQVNVDTCLAVAMAMKPYTAAPKRHARADAVLKEDFEKNRGSYDKVSLYVDSKGKTWSPLNYYIQSGGSAPGLLNKVAKWNTQSKISTKSLLPRVKGIFKVKPSEFSFQTIENELQALNKDARAGGWFMCMKSSDIQALGAYGAEGTNDRTNAVALTYHRALVLRIVRHFAPESELAQFADGLDLPPCTADDLAQPVFIAPKSEMVPIKTVIGATDELKTRPYGIFCGAWQALCSAYGSKDLVTFFDDPDCVSGIGVNYSWGDGPKLFYQHLLKVQKEVSKTDSQAPNGRFKIIAYGDDLIFITPDGWFAMDTTSADATINSEEMEFALSIILPLRKGYEALGKYLRQTIATPNVVFGKRLYQKNPGLLLSGSYGTSQIDIIALVSRYLLLISVRTGAIAHFAKGTFSWDHALYHPTVFNDLPDMCAKAGFKCSLTKTKELIPRSGLSEKIYLSSRFLNVHVGKGPTARKYLAFSPDHQKMLASLIHPKDQKKPLLIALRALGFAIMFPEYKLIYEAARNVILSVVAYKDLINPPDVILQDLTPEVNQAVKVIAPIVASNRALPSREKLIDFKFAGKPIEVVKSKLTATDAQTKAPVKVEEFTAPTIEPFIDLMTFATGKWADDPVPGSSDTTPSSVSTKAPPPKYDADKKALSAPNTVVPVQSLKPVGKLGVSETARLKKRTKEITKYTKAELLDLRSPVGGDYEGLDLLDLFAAVNEAEETADEEDSGQNESGVTVEVDEEDAGASSPSPVTVVEQPEKVDSALKEVQEPQQEVSEESETESSTLLEEVSDDESDEDDLDEIRQKIHAAYDKLGLVVMEELHQLLPSIRDYVEDILPLYDPERPKEFLESFTMLRTFVPPLDKALTRALSLHNDALKLYRHELGGYTLPPLYKLSVSHPKNTNKGGVMVGDRVYLAKYRVDALRKKYGDRMHFVNELGWEWIEKTFLSKKKKES